MTIVVMTSHAAPPKAASPKPAGSAKAAARARQQAQRRAALRAARAQSDDLLNMANGAPQQIGPASGSGAAGSGSSGYGGVNGFGAGGIPGLSAGTAVGSAGSSSGSSSSGTSGPSASGTAQGSSPSQAGGNGVPSTTFNTKIVQFALNHLGTEVGNGECWTLAADALIYAGARPANGYVFGATIPMADIASGDILQFESAVFVGTTYWMRLGLPHHTAIVYDVQGTNVTVLHQNYNDLRVVQKTLINFADMKSGTVTVYRAVPPN